VRIREGEKERERKSERERESVCIHLLIYICSVHHLFVCVCVYIHVCIYDSYPPLFPHPQTFGPLQHQRQRSTKHSLTPTMSHGSSTRRDAGTLPSATHTATHAATIHESWQQRPLRRRFTSIRNTLHRTATHALHHTETNCITLHESWQQCSP